MRLYDYQLDAVKRMKNGCILCGNVGSGKSLTALYYYITKVCEGGLWPFHKMGRPRPLLIITTAKKRDKKEWEAEAGRLGFGAFGVEMTVDSWNNIKKYQDLYGYFVIFDEQRVIGSGAWAKVFLKMTRRNQWVLLSATPGDQWTDYIPVFIANGFVRNKTEFNTRFCVYARFAKYPKIERYVGENVLRKWRDDILVGMEDMRTTERHEVFVTVNWDRNKYHTVMGKRWDPYENMPIAETGKLLYLLRRVVNENESRLNAILTILDNSHSAIIFYNYTYELELLRNMCKEHGILYSEWNGEKHEELVSSESNIWVYLVQYSAGCEGWNCIDTDTIIFYSQTYSYRVLEQASGRIDRINTPYKDLYYYHLVSSAPIDRAIRSKLRQKKNFNEGAFIRRLKR